MSREATEAPAASPAPDALEDLLECLRAAADGSLDAVLMYGSHLHGARPDRHSALDLVVVTDDYARFYRGLHDASEIHRPPGLMTVLSGFLPPNVIAFAPHEGSAALAKCLVVDRGDLERAVGPQPPDHFLLGRLVQRVGLVWVRDQETRRWMEGLLERARDGVLSWAGPWLEEPFDAESLGRTLLEVCYRGEFRPEATNRAQVVFDLQREHFREALQPGLDRAVQEGTIEPANGSPTEYRFTRPPNQRDRSRWRWHFRRSKARVTARWLKHVLTFDNWLPYVVRKVERRTGRKVELSRLEKRWPLLFLWPRAIRILVSRPDREETG